MSLAALKHSVGDHTQQGVTEQMFTQLRLHNVTRLCLFHRKRTKKEEIEPFSYCSGTLVWTEIQTMT